MTMIHCGFLPHQSLIYLTQLNSKVENISEYVHNEIIAKPAGTN